LFAQFSLHANLLKALAVQGLVQPTPVQAGAIPPALARRDLMVSAETGSGKTVAFLLPALQLLLQTERARDSGTQVLILTPTRELARQIHKQAQKLCEFTALRSGLITGGEDFKYQQASLRRNPEILIGTPGRLQEHLHQGTLHCGDLPVLVLDEADRMLDMGFSPVVLEIAAACNPERQTLLFSATLQQRGLREMAAELLREPESITLNAERTPQANIRQQIVLADHHAHKEQLLLWLLANTPHDKALIFTNTRERADQLDGLLRRHQRRAGVLHGEKEQNQRKRVLTQFREGHITALVATDVAARGLDIEGVELVINFDMARSGDDYVHRIGRTGRAGREGLAIALIAAAEWNLMSSIERYLHQRFEQRAVKGLEGDYKGPKKLKASGKAAGAKKKKTEGKKAAAAAKPKQRLRHQKQIGKRRVPAAQAVADNGETGFQPLKKKP
jgi:superfamily II DNA/RNA helicase